MCQTRAQWFSRQRDSHRLFSKSFSSQRFSNRSSLARGSPCDMHSNPITSDDLLVVSDFGIHLLISLYEYQLESNNWILLQLAYVLKTFQTNFLIKPGAKNSAFNHQTSQSQWIRLISSDRKSVWSSSRSIAKYFQVFPKFRNRTGRKVAC